MPALFPVVLLVVIVATYAPALEHMPRADQWGYLLDTLDEHGFVETFASTYSYNRTRQVAPGDTDLFRPLLFLLLAAEKACFGTNFVGVQATGIALHFLVSWLFCLLLRRIAQSSLLAPRVRSRSEWTAITQLMPYVLTIFFAVNFSVQELVIWSHLHGYLLFLLFVLGSMLVVVDHVNGNESKRRLAWAWLLALLSAFTYELGQFYAVLAGVLAAAHQARPSICRRAAVLAAFAAILVIYQAADRVDRYAHRGRFLEEDTRARMLERLLTPQTAENTARFVTYTTVQSFFPSAARWWLWGGRLNILEACDRPDLYTGLEPKLLLSYAVAASFAMFCAFGLVRSLVRRHASRLLILLLPLSLYALYAAMAVLGRMNLRPSAESLTPNSYYCYTALVLALLAAWVCWQGLRPVVHSGTCARESSPWREMLRARNARGILAGAVLVGLLALSGISAVRVHGVADKIRLQESELRALINGIREFVQSHGAEPGFSFAFDADNSDAVDSPHSIPAPVVLFRRWLNPHEPKYVLSWQDRQMRVQTLAEYRREYGPPTGQLLPEVIRIGMPYNVFRYRGTYYGVLHWNGYFSSRRDDYAYLLQAPTLAELEQQQPLRLAEQARDIRAGRFVSPFRGASWVEKGYRGFNLFRSGDYYYGLPQHEGPFNAARFNEGGYRVFFVADTVPELRGLIDQYD